MVYRNLLVIGLLWLPQAIHQLLGWIYWWQVKEYRLDRIKVFLSTKTGRRNLGIHFILLKLLSIFIAMFLSIPSLTLLVLVFTDIASLREALRRQLRKPVFTQRAINIFSTSWFLVLFGIFTGTIYFQSLLEAFLLSELALILGFIIGVGWTSLVSRYIRAAEIKKARQRLLKIKPIVIGVTGSYGKTSTKEFIAHLLSLRFNVAKTEGSQNTEFALARTAIIIPEDTDFFVVEMGAYRKGEIKSLAEIVNPDIGVLTGIEPQHISLFGSLQNILDTKFELIEALPPTGIAVFNLSNVYCRKLYDKAKMRSGRLRLMGYNVYGQAEKDIFVSKIVSSRAGEIHFIIDDGESKYKIITPLLGEHFVENLTAAIMIARQFNISWKEIKEGCKNLPRIEKRMEISNVKGAIIIDDSFNASPKSFAAAVKYLDFFKDRIKVIVTAGVIELGRDSSRIHRDLGKLMSKRVDEIILLDEDPYEDILAGLGKQKDLQISVINNPGQAIKRIEEVLEKRAVLLLEGKIPSLINELIEKNKNA
ncbi:MAG: Mur ligase family protein [Patescibacteria group bacterium]